MANVAITWQYKCYVRLLLMPNERTACFPTNGNFRKPIPTVFCCSVKGHIFVDLLEIKDKFHCQVSIIIHGVSAYDRESKQKKNPIFHFQNCPRPLTRECPLTRICEYRV